jgi:hypothetical protein
MPLLKLLSLLTRPLLGLEPALELLNLGTVPLDAFGLIGESGVLLADGLLRSPGA